MSRVVGYEVEGEVVIVDRARQRADLGEFWQLQEIGITVDSRIECWTEARTTESLLVETFASLDEGELLAAHDAVGLVAMAVNLADAAATLGLKPDDRLTLRRSDS